MILVVVVMERLAFSDMRNPLPTTVITTDNINI